MKNLLKKKWFRWISVILIFGVIGFLIIRGKSSKKIESTTVQKGQIKEELVLTGSIEADKHVRLYFPTGGKISAVYVKEGQWVKKGQILTSLDKTILNTIYQQAINTHKNYQAAAENILDSVKDHTGDETYAQKATRTAAEVARDNAYDAMLAAEYNLKNATLYAPFAGYVTSLPFPNSGVNIMATDVQVELIDPSTIYFAVEADQNEVTSIKEQMPVTIVLDSFRDRELAGIVSFVSFAPKVGEASTIYEIKVQLAQDSLKDIQPRIGMSGDARFVIKEKDNALYVPTRFVNSDKDGKYVNLGKMGNKVRVETGIEGEENIEILSGVKEGDTLFD